MQVYNNGENTRSFTYVDDVVDGVIAALFSPPMFQKSQDKTCHAIYNIGTTEMVTTNRLVELIEKNLHKKAIVKFVEAISCDMLATLPDLENIKRNLGYDPKVPVEEGIEKFVAWYKDYQKTERKRNH